MMGARNWLKRERKQPTLRRVWTKEQRDATPAQFKAMMPSVKDESKKIALEAGRKMGERLFNVNNVVARLEDWQIETWRRRYGVPPNLKAVMLAAAVATVKDERLRIQWERTLAMKEGTNANA